MNLVAALVGTMAGGVRPKIQGGNVTDSDIGNGSQNANLVWDNNGNFLVRGIVSFQWLLFGEASNYELLVTGSGDTPGGTGILNTWQNMGSDLGYALSVTIVEQKEFTGTYSIRIAGGGAVLAGGTFHLLAWNTGP